MKVQGQVSAFKPWVENYIHPANAQTIPPHTDITLCALLGDSDTMSIC